MKICLRVMRAKLAEADVARPDLSSELECCRRLAMWRVCTCALTILCLEPIVKFAAVSFPALAEDKFDDTAGPSQF
ncbi:unnamed protein product [Colias eurytheme]|nr:unnamed protein product [Colias eurytheme]